MRPRFVDAAGMRLGSYQTVRAIGAGGMGEVYRAHDAKLGRARRDWPPSAWLGLERDVDLVYTQPAGQS